MKRIWNSSFKRINRERFCVFYRHLEMQTLKHTLFSLLLCRVVTVT